MPSKEPKDSDQSKPYPKITSRVIPRPNLAAEQEALPAGKQVVHDLLGQYLDFVIGRNKTARRAEKKCNDLLKIEIVAAMAVLYAPWDEEEWILWYQRIARRTFKTFFVDAFGRATLDLVNYCKFLQSTLPLSHMISDLVQG